MFIKKKLKYFTRPKQISPDMSGVSGDFRIVWCKWNRKKESQGKGSEYKMTLSYLFHTNFNNVLC